MCNDFALTFMYYETQVESYRIYEERTGHKQLSVGDWGSWFCVACKEGDYDGRERPEDFSCVPDEWVYQFRKRE